MPHISCAAHRALHHSAEDVVRSPGCGVGGGVVGGVVGQGPGGVVVAREGEEGLGRGHLCSRERVLEGGPGHYCWSGQAAGQSWACCI